MTRTIAFKDKCIALAAHVIQVAAYTIPADRSAQPETEGFRLQRSSSRSDYLDMRHAAGRGARDNLHIADVSDAGQQFELRSTQFCGPLHSAVGNAEGVVDLGQVGGLPFSRAYTILVIVRLDGLSLMPQNFACSI